MIKTKNTFLFCIVILLILSTHTHSLEPSNEWLQQLHLIKNTKPSSDKKSVVIAVIDDGVRISHQDIKDFIWKNPLENPENGMDDDGNNYINDIHGWDVADNDNNILPPQNTQFDFYHGTHLAGIITQIATATYGEDASNYIKIMPVKSLQDEAENAYIKSGYEGIEYAINSGVDIILAAWGGGHISEKEQEILNKAQQKGILVIAAGGNFSNNKPQYPAASAGVLSIAAIDSNNQKIKQSNFGDFVDLSTFGSKILSASFKSDTEYESHTGTSQATAIATAAAAIVKLQNPSFTAEKIKACLKQSANPIDEINPRYSSKLGAGALNIKSAVACELFNKNVKKEDSFFNPQGYIYLDNNSNHNKSWTIKPHGEFKGFRFKTILTKGNFDRTFLHVHKDSKPETQPFLSYPLAKIPDNMYLPGTTAFIRLETNNNLDPFEILIEYKAEPIDFTKLYCKGTKHLKTEGIIEDGSGENDYSYNSDCKWLITAPKGKVIHFNFTELDTEGRTDLIYFFNGPRTNNSQMAIFSGPDLPPQFTTWRNQVLVWFVTDGKNQGKGWKAEYRFIDPKK